MEERISCITLPTPFAVGDVNVYLIEGKKLTLVDTGPKMEEAWAIFERQLEGLGYQASDIKQVVLTHHHPDHVGLSDYLKVFGVRFISLTYNIPWLKKDPAFLKHHDQFYEKVYKEMGIEHFHRKAMEEIRRYLDFGCEIEVDTVVTEGDQIDGLDGWVVLETPGHAQGHLSLLRKKDGVMVGGDHVIKHISSNALIEPPSIGIDERPKTLLQYRDSLQKVVRYGVKKVYPGHGQIVEDPVGLIQERLIKHEERAQKILNMIEQEELTGIEICKRLFPTIYLKELGLTMSETLGHLDLLQSEGKLVITDRNGVLHFQAKEVNR